MSPHHTAEEPAPGTVGRLVVERPSRARVFEKFGIDYCCGGRKPLEQACRDRQVDVQAVLDELRRNDEQRPAERNWPALGLAQLADHIEKTHHGYLRQELARLDFLTQKVAAVHGERHPELVRLRDVFAVFKAELLNHMQKEELVVFPLCRRLEAGGLDGPLKDPGLQRPVDVLTHEHDDAGAALAEIRRLTNGFTPPADACNTYRALFDSLRELEADMHQHVHLENNVLFPAALKAYAALPKG